jgi:hypothetical protein
MSAGQSEPGATRTPASRRSRMRHPRLARTGPSRVDQLSLWSAAVYSVQWLGCMLAVTGTVANVVTRSSAAT